jgi:hypothetical protein
MQQISIFRYAEQHDAYRNVASEYYDEKLHPTCANFRAASKLVFEKRAASFRRKELTVLEVGAGKSLYAEVCPEWRELNQSLTLNDSVPEMLTYSHKVIREGATVLVGDISHLPMPPASIDLLVSSLGDPYNVNEFWLKCTNLLRTDGLVLFTTPSYAWARIFRDQEANSMYNAEFVTSKGHVYGMPSYILEKTKQLSLMEAHDLLVVGSGNVTLDDIQTEIVSEKLLEAKSLGLPILDWYLCKKNNRS